MLAVGATGTIRRSEVGDGFFRLAKRLGDVINIQHRLLRELQLHVRQDLRAIHRLLGENVQSKKTTKKPPDGGRWWVLLRIINKLQRTKSLVRC